MAEFVVPLSQRAGHFTVANTLYQPYPTVMHPFAKGLFGTYSSYTHIMANLKWEYGQVWGEPIPPNCRVV